MTDKSIALDQTLKNPFTPDFGKIPAYFAGREEILNDLLSALNENDAGICTLFVGARGTGKTALLAYLSNEAERFGWISANVTSIPGMLEDIVQRIKEKSSHLIETDYSHKIDGFGISGIGNIHWDTSSPENLNWRSQMNALLNALADKNVGVLITVDEVDVTLDEMNELIATYQHFVREDRKVALLMAGLPYNILGILNGKSTSFLRRAQRFNLETLRDFEVEEAFRLTVENGGRFIEQNALDEAVKIIGGFPFLFQLLGYRAWRQRSHDPFITIEDVQTASKLAKQEMETRIFDVTYAELSKGDRSFLNAMLLDEDETNRIDLMKRLGKSSGHISTYKKRLIQGGVIDETVNGAFTFSLPGFREYLEKMQE